MKLASLALVVYTTVVLHLCLLSALSSFQICSTAQVSALGLSAGHAPKSIGQEAEQMLQGQEERPPVELLCLELTVARR